MLLDDQILDALDTKYACNTIEFLLGELVKLNLLNEQQGQKFSTAREPIALSLSKIELNAQLPPPIIKMVKQASTPLAGILKALDCDYNKIQESLLEILAKALNGNSFELILSVASIEGKLKTFVSRLIRCNEGSKQVAGETDKAAASRAALFDISFLMLTFIVQNYGVEVSLATIKINFDKISCRKLSSFPGCAQRERRFILRKMGSRMHDRTQQKQIGLENGSTVRPKQNRRFHVEFGSGKIEISTDNEVARCLHERSGCSLPLVVGLGEQNDFGDRSENIFGQHEIATLFVFRLRCVMALCSHANGASR